MSEQRIEIPLFPLHTVLFPQSRLQLHIFEPRYRQMISGCISSGGYFGVTLIREGSESGDLPEPYLVGTLVRILDIHTYSDGRFDITVLGLSRFRVRELDETGPFFIGSVETVEDAQVLDPDRLSSTAERCRELCDTIVRQQIDLAELSINVIFPDGPEGLSYAIANMLDLPLLRKQSMLELTDTQARLDGLIEVLDAVVGSNSATTRRLRAIDLKDWASIN